MLLYSTYHKHGTLSPTLVIMEVPVHIKSVHMHMSHGSVCDGMSPNSPVLRCFAVIMHLGSGYTPKGARKVAELAFGRDLVSMEISCASIRNMVFLGTEGKVRS